MFPKDIAQLDELVMHVIAERKWRNAYLVIMANARVSGKPIKEFLDLDDKFLKKHESAYPGLTAWYKEVI